jgi:hypothetical protein
VCVGGGGREKRGERSFSNRQNLLFTFERHDDHVGSALSRIDPAELDTVAVVAVVAAAGRWLGVFFPPIYKKCFLSHFLFHILVRNNKTVILPSAFILKLSFLPSILIIHMFVPLFFSALSLSLKLQDAFNPIGLLLTSVSPD